MTTTYDPRHGAYFDEADVRTELSRVFDICDGCRLCTNFCGSFPTLFDMIGQSADRGLERSAGSLTPAQQDMVVDECFQCKLCVASCPFSLESDERRIDFPRLVLRTQAMRRSNGQRRLQRRTATLVLAHTDFVGWLGTTFPAVSNRLVSARPGSVTRKLLARVAGASTTCVMPPFARQRFSEWFRDRETRFDIGSRGNGQASVVVHPTCLVEYRETSVGRDLVDVYERSDIVCTVSKAGCCGAPWLHAGYVKKFTKQAAANVSKLADEVRTGRDVVVLQPMCEHVLKQDYPVYLQSADSELVAAHTFGASEYLVELHRRESTQLDPSFPRSSTTEVTWRPSSHGLTQNIGEPGRELIALTGARVLAAVDTPGDLGWWGMRAGNEEVSTAVITQLIDAIDGARNGVASDGGSVVAGECLLTNAVIAERSGIEVLHPLEVVARAYRAAVVELDEL